jgi:hypothetical protein
VITGDGREPVPDGPAVVGLVLPLPSEWRGAVLEPVTPADGLPAFLGDREP